MQTAHLLLKLNLSVSFWENFRDFLNILG